jgi:hypothetical protein
MSVSSEVTRIEADRNAIRSTLQAWGLAQATDNLDDLADALAAVVNRGAVAVELEEGETYTVPQGYHDGSGTVDIDANEQAKLIPANIRQGITVLGVTGTMSGSENVKAQSKEVTPSAQEQTVLPDSGYNSLTSVTVKAIPYTESANSAGGTTVTIG